VIYSPPFVRLVCELQNAVCAAREDSQDHRETRGCLSAAAWQRVAMMLPELMGHDPLAGMRVRTSHAEARIPFKFSVAAVLSVRQRFSDTR
jgi:hypothetical protein